MENSPTKAAPNAVASDADASRYAAAEALMGADGLGRAGPVVLDAEGFREAIAEAKVIEHWRTGTPPPHAALKDPALRRRLLSRALEQRVLRFEAIDRGLVPAPDVMKSALSAVAAGRPLDTPGPQIASSELDGALAARYDVAPERVRRAVADLLIARLMADHILDSTPDEDVRQAWRDENTHIVLDVVRIPRVPTSSEISAMVKAGGPAFETYYSAHQALFKKPARAYTRRLLIAPIDDSPAAWAAAKSTAAALRAKVVAGADFEVLARSHSAGREAKDGGRMRGRTRRHLPAAFEVAAGALTPLQREAKGWAFYRVDQLTPQVERSLSAPGTRREIAAALLREADTLSHARALAERTRALFGSAPDGEALNAHVAQHRLRRATTEQMKRSGPPRIPKVGYAPSAFKAAFALTMSDRISKVFTVRQEYVVLRLVSRDEPLPGAWTDAREGYRKAWTERHRPTIVESWLSKRLKNEPLWIDTPRLNALSLEALGL